VYSLIILSVLVISGTSTIVAAVVAPLISVVLPVYIDSADAALWLQLGYGVAAIAAAMLAEGGASTLLGRLTRSRAPEGQAPARSVRRLQQSHPGLVQSRLQEVRPHANA
jgi:hypothetical protein